MTFTKLRLLLPLSCGALLVVVACSSSSDDEPDFCSADFPCGGRYGCVDESSYAAVKTVSCQEVCGTTNCTGASCKFVETKPTPTACPTGTRCDSTFYNGGVPGYSPEASAPKSAPPCVPLDAGADAASDAADEDAAATDAAGGD